LNNSVAGTLAITEPIAGLADATLKHVVNPQLPSDLP